MPFIALFFLLAFTGTVSSCVSHEADALEVTDDRDAHADRIDAATVRDEVREYVCGHVDCPDHVTVDELKLDGHEFAAAKVSTHFYF